MPTGSSRPSSANGPAWSSGSIRSSTRFPSELREKARRSTADAADAILEFNRRVLDAVAEHAAAVKPQSAFYEALGWEGVRAFAETIRAAHDCGLLVIADVKRGDIGSTAEAYAQGHLDLLQADAVTVNPYLGMDGIAPFLKRAKDGKGIFVLVKTSNPSSVELQDLDASGAKLYEKVAELVERWGGDCRGRIRLQRRRRGRRRHVPGRRRETAPADAARAFPRPRLRRAGRDGRRLPARASTPQGRGAVVNSSRGIIFAYRRPDQPQTPPDWDSTVARAAAKMKEELERVRLKGMSKL